MRCNILVRMMRFPALLLAASLAHAQEPPTGEKDRQPGAGAPRLQVVPYGGGCLGAGAAFRNTTGNPDRTAEFESLQGANPNAWFESGRTSRATGRVQATFTSARSENLDRSYGFDTRVASGIYTVDLGGKARLVVRARNLEIDSDSIFVDVAEPVANSGPQLGKTFAQSYPYWGTADYSARSAEARKVFTGGIDGRIVLPRRTTFRFGYEYESLERPWFEVKETNTQRLRLSIQSRPWKELAARAGYTYTRSDYPFTHVKAALTPEIQPTVSPGSPPSPLLGTKYFTLYDRRQANLSNFPVDSHRSFASATWTPEDWFALSAHLRAYRDRNDKLNYAPWSDAAVAPSAEAWIALSPRVDVTAGYALAHRTTDTLFVVPVFDG